MASEPPERHPVTVALPQSLDSQLQAIRKRIVQLKQESDGKADL